MCLGVDYLVVAGEKFPDSCSECWHEDPVDDWITAGVDSSHQHSPLCVCVCVCAGGGYLVVAGEEFPDSCPECWHEDPVDDRITAGVDGSHQHIDSLYQETGTASFLWSEIS